MRSTEANGVDEMELDPRACQEYLDYMRAFNAGKKAEAEYHKYVPFSLFTFEQIKFLVGVGFAYLVIVGVVYIVT